jgi:hypothetical protein
MLGLFPMALPRLYSAGQHLGEVALAEGGEFGCVTAHVVEHRAAFVDNLK